MDSRENPHLVGQIALEGGFVTPDQLEECLLLQARSKPARSLGWIMVEAGYLTEGRLAKILSIQETRFERLLADPERGGLFGQLAVRLGYLTAAQLHDALREQEATGRAGSSLLLGQILLRSKSITTDQFLEILRRQRKEVASCPVCRAFYDLSGHPKAGPFVCSSCQAVIHPGASSESGRAQSPSPGQRAG